MSVPVAVVAGAAARCGSVEQRGVQLGTVVASAPVAVVAGAVARCGSVEQRGVTNCVGTVVVSAPVAVVAGAAARCGDSVKQRGVIGHGGGERPGRLRRWSRAAGRAVDSPPRGSAV